jgi:hypothetical protein
MIKRPQTMPLFIFSRVIMEAREAAAPTSNAIAKLIANHVGLDNLKKSITWIVDITETRRYRVTKVPIIK